MYHLPPPPWIHYPISLSLGFYFGVKQMGLGKPANLETAHTSSAFSLINSHPVRVGWRNAFLCKEIATLWKKRKQKTFYLHLRFMFDSCSVLRKLSVMHFICAPSGSNDFHLCAWRMKQCLPALFGSRLASCHGVKVDAIQKLACFDRDYSLTNKDSRDAITYRNRIIYNVKFNSIIKSYKHRRKTNEAQKPGPCFPVKWCSNITPRPAQKTGVFFARSSITLLLWVASLLPWIPSSCLVSVCSF